MADAEPAGPQQARKVLRRQRRIERLLTGPCQCSREIVVMPLQGRADLLQQFTRPELRGIAAEPVAGLGHAATHHVGQVLELLAGEAAFLREQGTFDQLLVTPLRPFEIMAGKAMPSVLIGVVQGTGILLVAQLWFRIPFAGSFVTLYIGLSLFLLAAVGIGLLISSLVATMQQAVLFNFIVVMPFTLLSGLATPINNIPQVLQYVTLVNPLRYAIEIAQRVYLEGAGLKRLAPELWPMATIALVTLSAAAWMFRRRLG